MPRSGHTPSHRYSGLHLLLLLLVLALPAAGLAGCSARADAPPGTLVYDSPQTYSLQAGDVLPGTDIRYIGPGDEGAEFDIGGERAVKQKADSLRWSGSPADGVRLDLQLRIVWYTQDALYAAGTGRLTVCDVAPQAGLPPAEAPLVFQAPVAHRVALGETVPGTTLSYEGQDEAGARFGGLEGYALRCIGDSVIWEGQLRPGAMIRQELRLVQYAAESAHLVGVARIWVTS